MISFVKKIFKKNTSVADEYDKEAFSRFGEDNRLVLLEHFSQEKKEHDLRSFHDESDALIYSLASLIMCIGTLVIPQSFDVPKVLFLFTAIFALYFSIISLLRTGTFKTCAMIFSFPFAMILTTALVTYGANIDDINNGLSLIALGLSLTYIVPQKRKERRQLKINKLKNDMLLDQDQTIRAQEANITVLSNHLKKLEERIDNIISKQNEEMLEELEAMEREIEKLIESTESSELSEVNHKKDDA